MVLNHAELPYTDKNIPWSEHRLGINHHGNLHYLHEVDSNIIDRPYINGLRLSVSVEYALMVTANFLKRLQATIILLAQHITIPMAILKKNLRRSLTRTSSWQAGPPTCLGYPHHITGETLLPRNQHPKPQTFFVYNKETVLLNNHKDYPRYIRFWLCSVVDIYRNWQPMYIVTGL